MKLTIYYNCIGSGYLWNVQQQQQQQTKRYMKWQYVNMLADDIFHILRYKLFYVQLAMIFHLFNRFEGLYETEWPHRNGGEKW